jgi:hypothetical protein
MEAKSEDKTIIDSEELINKLINSFLKDREPTDRYTSFDYCYNYFRDFKNNNKISEMAVSGNLQVSCLHLGFYLASWGMLRGSSYLLQKNIKYYESLIKEISNFDGRIWSIDVDNYTEENMKLILDCYEMITNTFVPNGVKEETIVTKIMLGVFGCVPAFDQNFCNGFREFFKGKCGFRRLNIDSLSCIKEFYESDRNLIDKWSNKIKTIDFKTGDHTNLSYSRAKIIDMIGFTYGLVLTKLSEMKKQK